MTHLNKIRLNSMLSRGIAVAFGIGLAVAGTMSGDAQARTMQFVGCPDMIVLNPFPEPAFVIRGAAMCTTDESCCYEYVRVNGVVVSGESYCC